MYRQQAAKWNCNEVQYAAACERILRLNSKPFKAHRYHMFRHPDHALLKLCNTVSKDRWGEVRRKTHRNSRSVIVTSSDPRRRRSNDQQYLLCIYGKGLHHSACFRLAPFICILSIQAALCPPTHNTSAYIQSLSCYLRTDKRAYTVVQRRLLTVITAVRINF
jgi:hypothetical protein